MNNYQLSDELVKNKFCTVYKGRKRNTAEFYAILSMDKSRRDRVLRSVQTLRVLTHPSIVSFHNWYETSNHLWVITEYCSSGDMHSVLSLKDPLHPTSVRAYSRDAVLGLLYIHTRGVLYNNVKPSKLLLDSSCTLRYFDFGLSCLFTEAKDRSPVGTPLYMAPELFISGVGVPSVASDIWSLGCFMYELAAGQPPFSSEKLEDLMKEVQGSSYKPVERMDAEFNSLVQSMLEKDPLRRATWKDVVESGFWGEKITQDVHLPPEPAFDAYKRRYSGREWSAERLRLGLSRSIAAARFRQGQKNLESEDVSYLHGDLGATVEVDFTPLDAPVQDDEDEVDQGGKGAVPSSETVANPRSRSAEAAASATVDTQRSEILSIPPNHSCPSIHPTANINQVPTPPLKPAPLPATGWVETPAEKDLEATSMQEERHEVFSNSQSAPESLDQSNFTGFTVEGSSAETLVSEMRLASLLWQNADAHIRPLCLNNRLERYVEPTYNPELLEFQPYSASEIKKISREELTQFLAVIYRALSSTTVSASDKLNTLRYFEAVCVGTSTASVLVNSSIMTLCMKLCDQPNAAVEFRAAAASIIGLLVRHTTFIHTNLAKSGIFPDTLKLFWTEKDVMVRRKLLACSGEMLFYIAVQAAKDRPAWGIIPKDVLAVYQAALSSEDEILQHYAVKTIENLASVPDNEIVSSIFCNPATVDLLIRIYKTRSSNEQMASSALCAALKLAIGCESLMSHIFKSKDFPCSSYATTFSDCKVFYTAQLLITFLNYVMVKSMMAIDNSFTKAWIAAAAAEDEKSSRNRDQGPATSSLFVGSNVTPTDAVWMLTTIAQMSDELLVHLCNKDQQANVIIRGKTLLFTLLLGCLGGNTLSKLCESSHHVTYLDRLMRYKDSYVQRCASQMAVVLSLVVLEKIKVTSERVSFHSTAVYLSSTLQILSASAIRSMLQLQPDVFAYLAVCMDKSLTNSIYRNYLDRFVGIAERLTQNAEVVLQYAIPICQHIVKPFAHMLQRNSGAQRFAALRFLSTVMTPLLSDVQESSMSSKDSPPHETTAAAVEMVASAIINVLPELLTELPPLPSNALRLLVLCAEWMPKKPQYLGTESMADIIVQYVDKLSPDEEPDLLYPMKLLQIVFGSSSKRPDIALHAPRKEGNFLLLLRLALSSSYAKGQGQEVDCFCAVAVRVVLAYASAGNATLTANQCATFCEAEILGEVLLPLSVADARAPWGSDTAVNASMLVYHSVRLNRDSQPPLLSRKGLTSVALCLSEFNSVSSSSSSTVAGARDLAASNVLKGLRYVCECRPKDHVKRLVGQHQSLVSELWRVCEHRPKSIAAAEATRILEFL